MVEVIVDCAVQVRCEECMEIGLIDGRPSLGTIDQWLDNHAKKSHYGNIIQGAYQPTMTTQVVP